MKLNESGLSSLEIVIYVLIILGCICMLSGVFTEIKGVKNDNNIDQVEERNN